MISAELEREKMELQTKRRELVLKKREAEMKLLTVKNVVRTGGRMPNEKYRQCCDSQKKYVKDIQDIESELMAVKGRLQEIGGMENLYHAQLRAERGSNEINIPPVETPDIIRELVAIRQEYQNFAADASRVASMRRMASEFVLKLNPIIKRAINER